MNRVNSWLWIGAAEDGRDWQALERQGITAVVNVTEASDAWPQEAKQRMAYLRLNQADGQPVPLQTFDTFAAWLSLHAQPPQSQVLVHCGAGVSRAATFSALALMIASGSDWNTALALIRLVRPQIDPSPVLVASLVAWWLYRSGRPEALIGAR